jgi:hypothetical protein
VEKNKADKEFEDEMEAVLHGARDNEDEELLDVSGGGYVVIVYEAMVFGCSSKGLEECQGQLYQAGIFGLQGKESVYPALQA